MRTIKLLLFLAIIIFLLACPNDKGDKGEGVNGEQNTETPVTDAGNKENQEEEEPVSNSMEPTEEEGLYTHECQNGTPKDGRTNSIFEVHTCVSCNEGYILNADNECEIEYEYVCSDGTPIAGPAPGPNIEKCESCRSARYHLRNDRCQYYYSYHCEFGTPKEGGTYDESKTKHCISCDERYVLVYGNTYPGLAYAWICKFAPHGETYEGASFICRNGTPADDVLDENGERVKISMSSGEFSYGGGITIRVDRNRCNSCITGYSLKQIPQETIRNHYNWILDDNPWHTCEADDFDFVVKNISVSSNEIEIPGKITVTATVHNTGTEVSPPGKLNFGISPSERIVRTWRDTRSFAKEKSVSFESMEAGEEITFTSEIDVDLSPKWDTWNPQYWGACVQPFDDVARPNSPPLSERNMDNNCSSTEKVFISSNSSFHMNGNKSYQAWYRTDGQIRKSQSFDTDGELSSTIYYRVGGNRCSPAGTKCVASDPD